MALQFDPCDVNEFLVLFWMQVDGDTCEESEFRAFAGCARMMNLRGRIYDLGFLFLDFCV